MEVVFWLSLVLIGYSYFGYPVLLMLIAKNKPVDKQADSPSALPSVTVVIAAYNEESCIEQRINNLLALDYPQEKLNVLIGSDGSTDATASILNQFVNHPVITPVVFTQNRGKTSVLNELLSMAEDEIIVMSDANTDFAPDVIHKLVRHFDDPAVGAVCGELNLVEAQSNNNKDGIYWRYERFLKQKENHIDAVLGANGANYALRKSLFRPLPANTIVDDFQIAMNVSRAGYRVVYDADAKATEEVAPDLRSEEGRRVRIGSGNYQAFFANLWALNPTLGWRCVAYISHKVLRWFAPHLLIIIALSNLFLVSTPFYLLTLLAQTGFYLIAWWGITNKKRGRKVSNIIALPAFFVAMNVALLRGFIRFISADLSGTWQRTQR
ncbi:glycosyltransferase family 2 protein [Alteromonas halophila]|uniref:Glycosyl transferase n=1 Tax=Alteromonas halophila TaxID=516698 RepID=A0A918MYZ2_9ALTE|nr:glycosyltransferase family 2 protein [Alteromonas halophila]GGW87036.1 glycosyl transferase [Alteromonas halophila]